MLDVINENAQYHLQLVKHITFRTWVGNQGEAGVKHHISPIKELHVPFCGHHEASIRTQPRTFAWVLQRFKTVWSCSPVILIVHVYNFLHFIPQWDYEALCRDGELKREAMVSVTADEAWDEEDTQQLAMCVCWQRWNRWNLMQNALILQLVWPFMCTAMHIS